MKIIMWLLVVLAVLGYLPTRSQSFVPSTRDLGCMNKPAILPDVTSTTNTKDADSDKVSMVESVITTVEPRTVLRRSQYLENKHDVDQMIDISGWPSIVDTTLLTHDSHNSMMGRTPRRSSGNPSLPFFAKRTNHPAPFFANIVESQLRSASTIETIDNQDTIDDVVSTATEATTKKTLGWGLPITPPVFPPQQDKKTKNDSILLAWTAIQMLDKTAKEAVGHIQERWGAMFTAGLSTISRSVSDMAREFQTVTQRKTNDDIGLAQKMLEIQQAKVEFEARMRHDSFAVNTLLLPVEEHSEPTPCSLTGSHSECWGKTSLPEDLPGGALLRIGPNGASSEEGWLDGDGMIQCVVIPDDKATLPVFSSTYVDTRGRSLERQAGGSINKRYRGTLASKGLSLLTNVVQNGLDFKTHILQKDTCNTAMARSGSRIMALMEQSPPSEIEITRDGRVRTVGNMCRLDGAVKDAVMTGGTLGSHGRTDPESGERIHLSYDAVSKPYVRADVFDADWKLKSSVGIDVPAPIMLHDCDITKNYIIVMDFPLTCRPQRLAMDKFPVAYEPEHGARIGLVRRNGGQTGEVQWFDVSIGVVLHAANAFEREDGSVVLHGFKSLPRSENSFIMDYTASFLHQWVLDPKTGTVLDDRCLNSEELVEFPVVEERFVGSDPGCIYGVQVTSIGGDICSVKTPEEGVLFHGVVKFATGAHNAGEVIGRYVAESGWHFTSEPTIVTKTSNNGHYVLLYATHIPTEDSGDRTIGQPAQEGSLSSRVLVLDGDDIAAGPVCSIDLPHHVTYGLHSLYVPWDTLK